MWKISSPLKLVCFLRITCHWFQNNLKLLLFIFFKSYAYWYSEQANNTFLKPRQVTLTLLDISLKSWIRLLQYRYVYDYWVINEKWDIISFGNCAESVILEKWSHPPPFTRCVEPSEICRLLSLQDPCGSPGQKSKLLQVKLSNSTHSLAHITGSIMLLKMKSSVYSDFCPRVNVNWARLKKK